MPKGLTFAESKALARGWDSLPKPRPDQVRYRNLYIRIRDGKPIALMKPNLDLVPQIQRAMSLPETPIYLIGRDLARIRNTLASTLSAQRIGPEFVREDLACGLRVTISDLKALLLAGMVDFLPSRKWRLK